MKKQRLTLIKQRAARSLGFTLVELMVVVALIAVVSAIAIPNFTEMIQRQNIASQMNEFMGAMHYARNQAIARGTYVTVCRAARDTFVGNQVSCSSTSITTVSGKVRSSDDWSTGWLVFVDDGGPTQTGVASGTRQTDELVLKRYPALPDNYSILKDGPASNYFTYNAQGQIPLNQVLNNITFAGGINSANKTICMAATGRFRTLPSNDDDCTVLQ